MSPWLITDFIWGFWRAYLNTGRPESQQPTGSQIIPDLYENLKWLKYAKTALKVYISRQMA